MGDCADRRCSPVVAAHHLPDTSTSFVGRRADTMQVCRLVTENRLVALTGAAGVGKSRMAIEVTVRAAEAFVDGVFYVDLSLVTNPLGVAVATARRLGLVDQHSGRATDALLTFIGERRVLLLLDNCEHLYDACEEMIVELLGGCPRLAIMSTSREPSGVPGAVTWCVLPLGIGDDAIELFTDRARQARRDFRVVDDNAVLVGRVCRRLAGMPLSIELAAARMGSMDLQQIEESLQARFRMLTGGPDLALSRQQTVYASLDWAHTLLTEPERVLFRRLAVFVGGFDTDAALSVNGDGDPEGSELREMIEVLVGAFLLAVEDAEGAVRYRLSETIRQYALEKLGASGEADEVRRRHRDYFTIAAECVEATEPSDYGRLARWSEAESDNLRAAYAWSREQGDVEAASRLVSSLRRFVQPARVQGDAAQVRTIDTAEKVDQ
ncbi:hypothetical protein H7I41_00610 [Mycobacterium manitobense]|uniref:Winged helix-turn-helix domain-containing protein n=1 Tax=[Mycobacterium] manitobense TaxID=190147 RepID=A0A9X2YIM6_9MYCO|nr:hypothetical protein [[Mycobacterium] manitobense]MCV7168414.1 hypothetical protein [[Mycobacterium] manitobense]